MSGLTRCPCLRPALLMLALLLAAGCSPYKVAGDQLIRFGEKQILPWALADHDVTVACKAAEAFTAPTLAFTRVGSDVDRTAVLLYAGDGMCAEQDAWAAELDYLRAMHQQRPDAAADARQRQKRAHLVAARRHYHAWQHFVAAYGELREGQCPKRFRNDFDETVFLVGLIAGVQAVINDAQTAQAIGVPRDIAPLAAHLSTCLDNEKWWYAPLSLQAALWAILPPLAPEGVEPMQLLEQNATRGAARGVRLGHVVWALSAHSSGDTATTRRALRDFARQADVAAREPGHRLLDRFAETVMLGLSDRIWTEATGARTPVGGLGSFPDDPRQVADDIQDLLQPD